MAGDGTLDAGSGVWYVAVPALFALGCVIGLLVVARQVPPVVPDGLVALGVGMATLMVGVGVGDLLT